MLPASRKGKKALTACQNGTGQQHRRSSQVKRGVLAGIGDVKQRGLWGAKTKSLLKVGKKLFKSPDNSPVGKKYGKATKKTRRGLKYK